MPPSAALFDPALIPASVQALLPPDYLMRPLEAADYSRGHLDLLRVLTVVDDPGKAAYERRFREMASSQPAAYFTLVILHRPSDRIVGCGTLLLERKFIRALGLVGHIEDIAVAKSEQGKKFGLRVINALTAISESQGAYKTILDCSKENIPFYQKCGFEHKEYECVKYASKGPLNATLKPKL